MNKEHFGRMIFIIGVSLFLGMGSAYAEGTFSVKPSAEEQKNYQNYKPSTGTMEKLREYGLPRYISLSPPDRQYLNAVDDVVNAVNGEEQISSDYGIYGLEDTVTADFAAKVVDLAFVYEGFRMPAPDGIKRAVSHGLTPLTMGQCADLFISSRLLQRLIRDKKFPMMQCPGTQADGAIAQIYFSRESTWRAGGLGAEYVDRSWPMAIYAGPHRCENC